MLFPVPVADVALEIGFGGGESMIAQAREHPRTGIIGVEPFINGMAKALAAIESAGLRNIRLHFDDAVSLIAWLPEASLTRIDLIHPDPWPKRRHWKRRFIQDDMVARLARILRPQGEFRFVTDTPITPPGRCGACCDRSTLRGPCNGADDWRKPWSGFAADPLPRQSRARRPGFVLSRLPQKFDARLLLEPPRLPEAHDALRGLNADKRP